MSSNHTVITPQAVLAVTLLLAAVAAAQTPAEKAAVDLARNTLAEQLRIGPERVEVAAVEARRWGGAVLHCRSPRDPDGESGIPGYLVRLRIDDDRFDLRVGQERAILCGINDTSGPARPERGTIERHNRPGNDISEVEEACVSCPEEAGSNRDLATAHMDQTFDPLELVSDHR